MSVARVSSDMGLFLKNYLETVSTVPRAGHLQAQPVTVPAARSRSADRGGEAVLLFSASPAPPPTAQQRRLSGEAAAAADAGPANLDSEKKKKWSLGGLFRRRRKVAAAAPNDSDSSSDDEAAGRRGFLGRRRSRRDQKRKARPKIVGTFDHIVVNPLAQSPLQMRHNADATPSAPLPALPAPPVPSAVSPPSSPPQPHPSGRRCDSSLSRCSSGGSSSVDGTGRRSGRRGRAMARAEAWRDQQNAYSSSDECGGFCQSPPLSHPRADDSPSSGRRTRTALRTERHFRRLSRDEEGSSTAAVRVPRAGSGRWTNAVLYQETCDTDPSLLIRTPSATPSPKQSPLVRPRQFHHYSPSTVVDIACTFPPNHSFWAPATRPPPSKQVCSGPPTRTFTPEVSPGPAHRHPDYPTPLPPRPFPSFETVCAKPAISCGDGFPQRSVSYDCDIHRPADSSGDITCRLDSNTTPNNMMHVQNPVAWTPHLKSAPPPPPRDPQRRLSTTPAGDSARPMSYAFETGSPQMARIEYSLNQPAALKRGGASSLRSLGAPSSGVWPIHQWRSSSENQLTASNVCARPASVTPEGMLPSMNDNSVIKSSDVPSAHFQYFTDQQPRSRRPIHIQLRGGPPPNDQTYLSDSQVVMKPPYTKRPMLSATEFWRQREQQRQQQKQEQRQQQQQQQQQHQQQQQMSKPGQQQYSAPAHTSRKLVAISNKLPLKEQLARPQPQFDVSHSNSPPPVEAVCGRCSPMSGRPFLAQVRLTDCQSTLSGTSDVATEHSDTLDGGARPLSMVLENVAESIAEFPCLAPTPKSSPVQPLQVQPMQVTPTHLQPMQIQPTQSGPPVPPTRRFSRQSSTSSLEATDWAGDDGSNKKHRCSSNLEDALNELEAIYKSLRLGDEDFLEQVEQREPPPLCPRLPALSDRPWRSGSCGIESDSGFNYSCEWSCRQRPVGTPDRVTDDMAYRRLNPKDRPSSQDTRALLSQVGSFLQASPAVVLSDTEIASTTVPAPSPAPEPDVTHDDVLFRSIKHANSTLRIQDPQPPFGIPLGPVLPASNSDYLHAKPVERPRSAFKPCKVPDVVKDDLAFRALRKDSQKESCLPPLHVINGVEALFPARSADTSNFSFRKKRAVRSLSASLMGLVHREPHSMMPTATCSGASSEGDHEKTQSLTDLPDALQVAQEILEGKEMIGGGSGHSRFLERPVISVVPPKGIDPHYGVAGASWVERALLDHSLGVSAGASTSTETLTDSRANQTSASSRRSAHQLTPSPPPAFDQKGPSHSAVAAAVADQTCLNELLSTLVWESSAANEQLDSELQQLQLKPSTMLDANCNVVRTSMKLSLELERKQWATTNSDTSCPSAALPNSATECETKKSLPLVLPPIKSRPKSASPVAAVAAVTSAAGPSPCVETQEHQLSLEHEQEQQEEQRASPVQERETTNKHHHETVDDLVLQCRQDLDELLLQVDAATRPTLGTKATASEGEATAAAPVPPWIVALEPLTALGLALALLLSFFAILSV